MKQLLFILAAGLALLQLSACDRPPEYPDMPIISFVAVDFQPKTANSQDTLGLTISFQDGDGDLGLRPEDILPPFNQLDSQFNPVTGQFDIVVNPNYYNFLVDVFRIRNGVPIKDNRSGILSLFQGRFPILNPSLEGDGIFDEQAIDGTLRHTFTSSFFQPANPIGGFNQTDTILMEIRIKDRRLHVSNTVQTPWFRIVSGQIVIANP